MTDPARWAWLNESEREVLRAAVVEREHHTARAYPDVAVRTGLVLAAWNMTDDVPLPAPIALPDGWEVANNATVIYGPGKVGYRPWLEQEEGFLMVRKLPSYSRAIPLSAVALLLRSAGWRVEGPK